jgi:choline dehydrogenase
LIVKIHTLVTRVLVDGTTAIDVEYREGARIYGADPQAIPRSDEPGPRQTMLVSHEMILSAGAFNSPPILKLSVIGPADKLLRHGIELVVDLPGVGENL